MNAKNTTKTFIIALAMMFTLAIGSSMAFGQNKAELTASPTEEQGNALAGAWQGSFTPRDCQTGEMAPFSIKVLFTFNQGGTTSEDEANPFDGPYRTSGHGIWTRVSGRDYIDTFTFYTFDADRTFTGTSKIRQNITLGKNSNSFTSSDTFEVRDPNGNLVESGCANATATRLTF